MMGLIGLGDNAAPWMGSTYDTPYTPAPTTAAKPNVIDQINNALTKIVQPAANVYATVKTGTQPQPGQPGYTPQPYPGLITNPPPPPAPEGDNTKKYLMIGGVLILVGTGIYFATRKKGKK